MAIIVAPPAAVLWDVIYDLLLCMCAVYLGSRGVV
jgi:hypothetical protein